MGEVINMHMRPYGLRSNRPHARPTVRHSLYAGTEPYQSLPPCAGPAARAPSSGSETILASDPTLANLPGHIATSTPTPDD